MKTGMKLIDREDAIKAMCYVCGNECTEEDMQNCPEHYALTHKPSAELEVIRDMVLMAIVAWKKGEVNRNEVYETIDSYITRTD